MTTLLQQVVARMKASHEQSARDRDQEWQEWYDRGGIFEVIKHPELGVPPSRRTAEEHFAIIDREIRARNAEK